MNDLDRLLENSMSALAARNEFVFESTKQHMHSVIKGGSALWPWVSVVSAVAVIGISLIGIQQTRINPIRVIKPVHQESSRTFNPSSLADESVSVPVPPLSITDQQTEVSPNARVLHVRKADKELAELFAAQSAFAESASQRSDYLLAATVYKDLARTCLLNNNKILASKAIEKALIEVRQVNSSSLLHEIELIERQIGR